MRDPSVLFLDEPTATLDPQSRLVLWEIVGQLHAEGQTILLRTHYIEEAERFCDRVAIMDHGRILALDTTGGLTKAVAGNRGSAPVGAAVERHLADEVTLETVFISLTGRDLRE